MSASLFDVHEGKSLRRRDSKSIEVWVEIDGDTNIITEISWVMSLPKDASHSQDYMIRLVLHSELN